VIQQIVTPESIVSQAQKGDAQAIATDGLMLYRQSGKRKTLSL